MARHGLTTNKNEKKKWKKTETRAQSNISATSLPQMQQNWDNNKSKTEMKTHMFIKPSTHFFVQNLHILPGFVVESL